MADSLHVTSVPRTWPWIHWPTPTKQIPCVGQEAHFRMEAQGSVSVCLACRSKALDCGLDNRKFFSYSSGGWKDQNSIRVQLLGRALFLAPCICFLLFLLFCFVLFRFLLCVHMAFPPRACREERERKIPPLRRLFYLIRAPPYDFTEP